MSDSPNSSTCPDQDKPSGPTLIRRLANPLVVMLVLFGLPYVAAWYFMNSENTFSAGQLGNNGELISPIVPLGEFTLETVNGELLSEQTLAGNWLLITTSTSCEQLCQDTLLLIRQARKSTGINRKVIKPILLLQTAETLTPFDVDLNEAFPQLSVIKSESSGAKTLLTKLSQSRPDSENSIYLVDPYNNLMMFYPAGTAPKGLMEDLKRLLKINKPKL